MSVIELDPTKVDLAKMAKGTGIPRAKIKVALGLPLDAVCAASTLEKVREAYYNAPDESEEQTAALLKWREFSTKEVAAASTLEEVRKAYYNTPDESEEQTAALLKWVELASILEEVREAYVNAPEGSKEETLALRKLATFYPLPE